MNGLIDARATAETVALFRNLGKLSEGGQVLFGHQSATEYGHGWSGDPDRSDVKSVTGSHPAVIGVDFLGLSGRPRAEIEANKAALRENVVATYDRGGVTTVCWHLANPVSDTDFYWKDDGSTAAAVPHLIPGGSHHEAYRAILADIADFARSAVGGDGALVPMIFRPFHEFDGRWFWWGKPHCTPEEFVALWRFTVGHLRDDLGVHNFVYCFSPDCLFDSEAQFLERYPGDEWVDMVGMDDYADFGRNGRYDVAAGVKKLRIVSDYARKAGKLAAFTETGLESVADHNWYTETLLPALKSDGLRPCYALVWRNDTQSPTHYYAPFPGHPSVPDFLRFCDDPSVLLERDLPPLYRG